MLVVRPPDVRILSKVPKSVLSRLVLLVDTEAPSRLAQILVMPVRKSAYEMHQMYL